MHWPLTVWPDIAQILLCGGSLLTGKALVYCSHEKSLRHLDSFFFPMIGKPQPSLGHYRVPRISKWSISYQTLYQTPKFLLMSKRKSFSFSHLKSVKYSGGNKSLIASDLLENKCCVEILCWLGLSLPGLCFSVFINDKLGFWN